MYDSWQERLMLLKQIDPNVKMLRTAKGWVIRTAVQFVDAREKTKRLIDDPGHSIEVAVENWWYPTYMVRQRWQGVEINGKQYYLTPLGEWKETKLVYDEELDGQPIDWEEMEADTPEALIARTEAVNAANEEIKQSVAAELARQEVAANQKAYAAGLATGAVIGTALGIHGARKQARKEAVTAVTAANDALYARRTNILNQIGNLLNGRNF